MLQTPRRVFFFKKTADYIVEANQSWDEAHKLLDNLIEADALKRTYLKILKLLENALSNYAIARGKEANAKLKRTKEEVIRISEYFERLGDKTFDLKSDTRESRIEEIENTRTYYLLASKFLNINDSTLTEKHHDLSLSYLYMCAELIDLKHNEVENSHKIINFIEKNNISLESKNAQASKRAFEYAAYFVKAYLALAPESKKYVAEQFIALYKGKEGILPDGAKIFALAQEILLEKDSFAFKRKCNDQNMPYKKRFIITENPSQEPDQELDRKGPSFK